MQAHGKNEKEGEQIQQDEENPFELESKHDEGASPDVVELDTANAEI